MFHLNKTFTALTLLCLPMLSFALEDLDNDVFHQVYKAKLSERDHFNSSGKRLNTAIAILRQDRANFHEFNIKDAEDESDETFTNKEARAYMEKTVSMSKKTERVILDGTPVVQVEIVGDSTHVTLVTSNEVQNKKINSKAQDIQSIVMGRCHMDSCWWWKVEDSQMMKSNNQGALIKVLVKTTNIDYPRSVVDKKGYPDLPPKKAKWSDTDETFIFCSNQLPAYFDYDKEQKKFVGYVFTGSYGVTEGAEHLYTHICQQEINSNTDGTEGLSDVSIDKPTDIFNLVR
jgi:hypothetical protein